MKYEFLCNDNVDKYIEYLQKALAEDPEQMWIEDVDAVEIVKRVNDSFYKNTKSILAIKDNQVVGRIEYHFYGCVQDGFKMAYVDYVYVLKDYRKQGIAKALFQRFEIDCKKNAINQYFLIRATNESANHFYGSFKDAQISEEPLLRKDIV